MAPGFPSPATMFETQFIEFTVKVFMGLSWKLLIMETLVLAVWWLVSGLLGRG